MTILQLLWCSDGWDVAGMELGGDQGIQGAARLSLPSLGVSLKAFAHPAGTQV